MEIIYARKEVILSAGAINSPKLLLLSGVGPVNDLQRHSFPFIQEVCTFSEPFLPPSIPLFESSDMFWEEPHVLQLHNPIQKERIDTVWCSA